MTLDAFLQDPWKKSHPKYKESVLSISPAPEYASSEVLIASLYRAIGFSSTSEGKVPQAGRDLDKRLQKLRDKSQPPPEGAVVDVDTWNTVLHGVLESPKLPNQSSKRFLQVTPLIPDTSLFSGSARLSSNSWAAGSLIKRMIWLGCKDDNTARKLWSELFLALSVEKDDDIFARWLSRETMAWTGNPDNWKLTKVKEGDVALLNNEDYNNINFLPARQFVKDLYAIIQAKNSMTRRQWTSLLEAVLRLATVSHVVWLCEVQVRIWNCLFEALTTDKDSLNVKAIRHFLFPDRPQYMIYGGRALQGFKDKASGYLSARLGINAFLWVISQLNPRYQFDISSSQGVFDLCEYIRENKNELLHSGLREKISDIREVEARALLCKKGIGANILEFARHTLGQRQTAIQLLRGYDQGYILKKKNNSPSSPWIVSLGPVAVLAFVHCALFGMGGPRSIHRLGQHLAAYGVIVDRHDIARNDLGYQLRMLGLVLDSPDAESGMLLLPPFPENSVQTDEKSN